LALHAEFAQLNQDALIYWNQAVQQAIAVGDVQLYTISQQEILNVIDYVDLPEKEDLKLSIYEQVGKINYEIDPAEAIKYLSTAIYEREKKNHIVQMIDLTGYLARSCDLTGNYTGVIECADKALALISKKEMPIEYSLLIYSKLEAIYNLGQFEEAITLARIEIIPTIEESINKNLSISGLNLENLNYVKFETELILSKALSAQGNKEASIVSNALALRAGERGYTDIEIQAREILFLKDRLNAILAQHSGRTLEQVKKDTDRDNYLSGKEAVEYGLIDKVVRSINEPKKQS